MSTICFKCLKIKKSVLLRTTEIQEQQSQAVLKKLLQIKRSVDLVSDDADIWLKQAIIHGFSKDDINDLFIKFDVVKKHIIGPFAVYIDPSANNLLTSEERMNDVRSLEDKIWAFYRNNKDLFDKLEIENRIRLKEQNTKKIPAEKGLEYLLQRLEREAKERRKENEQS